MSKEQKLQLLSPLFLKYQSDFEKNPRSRVFAPLAEAYRKLGMTEKAMEILGHGIRFHPTYIMGYLGLAFCYFDIKQFNLAYSTLRPLVESNRDNLRLQKLFADVCLELGRQEEALETLKYLLFINPRDKGVAELVTRLEQEIETRYRPQHKPIVIAESEFETESTEDDQGRQFFNVEKLESASTSNDFDDWMTLDLSHEKKSTGEVPQSEIRPTSALDYDLWNVKKNTQITPVSPVASEEKMEKAPVVEKNEKVISLDLHAEEHDDAPLITHTLVDLYCGQGHIEKAIEVLEKILILNPNDQRTIQKLNEIKALIQPMEPLEPAAPSHEEAPVEFQEEGFFSQVQGPDLDEGPGSEELTDLQETSEEDGRRHLMSIIDEKLGPVEIEVTPEESSSKDEQRVVEIEKKLNRFLQKIQKRALEYQSRV